MMKIYKKIIVTLMAVLGVASCTESSNNDVLAVKKELTITEVEVELNLLNNKMKELIGKAECNKDEQCRVIEFGSRSCGGPQSYIAYSTLNTDTVSLLGVSRAHVELSKKYNEMKGMLSICSVLEKPQVICNKKCEVKENKILIQ